MSIIVIIITFNKMPKYANQLITYYRYSIINMVIIIITNYCSYNQLKFNSFELLRNTLVFNLSILEESGTISQKKKKNRKTLIESA